MKKSTLTLLLLSALFGKMISQPIVSWNAPPNEQAGSNFALASGGNTAVYHRAAFLIKNSELAGLALTNSVITNVVFNYLQGINAATIGQFTLYLQNTADATYLKGTSWSTIITGMTSHYSGNYSIPVSNVTSATSLALSTTFAYTGGGIYVACNWYCPSANASQLAVVACNSSGLANGAVRAEVGSVGPAPTILNVSSFRPSINLLAQNTATNELSVSDLRALGKNSKLAGFSEVITAVVKNLSIGTQTNVSVGLGITGANTFLNSQTIPSIAPGATVLVSFSAFTPTNNGINTIQVSTIPDQYPFNNSAVWSQSTTCNNVRIPPANLTAGSFTASAYGAGANTSGIIYAFSYTTGTSTSSLGGVNCVIPGFANAANLGKQLYPVLCDNLGNIIATGSTLTIAANNMDVWNPMLFPSNPALMPNTAYLVGLGIPANLYFPIGNSPQTGVIGYYQVPITGGAPTAINYGNLAMEASLLFSSSNIIAAANQTLVCNGSAITLSATGGASTFTWNSISAIIPSTNGIATVTPAITGLSGLVNYTVNGTATGGCAANKAVITISVTSGPSITVNNGTICAGQSFTINPSGANTYTIQGGISVVSPSINTTYTVAGTNTAGCVSQAFATSITVNPSPTITVNNGAICAGQSFTINPNGANTYTIQGGNPVVSPPSNASFTVSGTSTAGCVSQAVATSSLTVNLNPIITVNNGTICAGQNFTINPNGANSYTIQGGIAVVSPTINANYTVVGTSTAGCVSQAFATSSLIVNQNPTITVNNGAICAGQNFTINPNGANTYTIQGGSSVVSPTSNASFTVSGTSTAGCVSQAFATSNLTVNLNPIITVNNGTICAGQNFTINPNGANSYTIQGGIAVVSPTINSTYTVAGTSTAGCISQAVATSSLIVNANPTITVNSGAICLGESFTLSPNGANTYTIQGGSAVVSPSINTNYTVVGSSTAGCISQAVATSSLTVNLCVGISNQNMGLGGVAIYPNPNNGEFTIELTNINNSNITITNVLGQLIKTQKAELINQININLFENGIYFINVKENNQSVYRSRIIKE